MIEFDKCPQCGAEPQFGLRSHPKFSVCFEGITDGLPDMHMAYFHNQEQNDNFANMPNITVIYKQKWNSETLKWEEYP